MMLLKKTVYDKLVAKVDNIDTSDFVLKTKYNTDKTELENKIPDVNNLVKKTKLTEIMTNILILWSINVFVMIRIITFIFNISNFCVIVCFFN